MLQNTNSGFLIVGFLPSVQKNGGAVWWGEGRVWWGEGRVWWGRAFDLADGRGGTR